MFTRILYYSGEKTGLYVGAKHTNSRYVSSLRVAPIISRGQRIGSYFLPFSTALAIWAAAVSRMIATFIHVFHMRCFLSMGPMPQASWVTSCYYHAHRSSRSNSRRLHRNDHPGSRTSLERIICSLLLFLRIEQRRRCRAKRTTVQAHPSIESVN